METMLEVETLELGFPAVSVTVDMPPTGIVEGEKDFVNVGVDWAQAPGAKAATANTMAYALV
jgi:hypothetical protein